MGTVAHVLSHIERRCVPCSLISDAPSHIERYCVPCSLIMGLVTVSGRRCSPWLLAEAAWHAFCLIGSARAPDPLQLARRTSWYLLYHSKPTVGVSTRANSCEDTHYEAYRVHFPCLAQTRRERVITEPHPIAFTLHRTVERRPSQTRARHR